MFQCFFIRLLSHDHIIHSGVAAASPGPIPQRYVLFIHDVSRSPFTMSFHLTRFCRFSSIRDNLILCNNYILSAGVGRTGTFMAIDILIQQTTAEGKIDVLECIKQLRTQRMNMVQTLVRYVHTIAQSCST